VAIKKHSLLPRQAEVLEDETERSAAEVRRQRENGKVGMGNDLLGRAAQEKAPQPRAHVAMTMRSKPRSREYSSIPAAAVTARVTSFETVIPFRA